MILATRKILFLVLALLILIRPAAAWFDDGSETVAEEEDDLPDINTIQRSDIVIADTINSVILHRVRQGQFSTKGWGFPYSRPPIHRPWDPQLPFDGGRCRWTPFDQGISLYPQRHRFKGLSVLAKERLQLKGYEVKVFEIFHNDRGIYLKWDITDPMQVVSRKPTGHRRFWDNLRVPGREETRDERHVYGDGYFGGEYNFAGEEPESTTATKKGKSDGWTRLAHFRADPWDFLVNGA
jgi:hypothetical protein